MPTTKRNIPIHAVSAGDEWHIAGVLVHARPSHLAAVREAIEAIAGSEIHAANDRGKLVVTLEAPTAKAIAAHLTFIHQIDGVLNAALVYQHNEAADAMNEDMNNDSLAPGIH